jgi:hypothetical protein
VRLRDEHARYFAAFGEATLAGVMSPAELEWWQRFSREIDNVRAALTWAIEKRDVDTTLRLLSLDDPRMVLSSLELGAVLHPAAEVALAIPGIADDPRYPNVLLCAAMHCHDRGDLEGVTRYCDEALEAEARLGVDPSPRVWGTRSWVAMAVGNVDDYVKYAESGLAMWRGRDEPAQLTTALTAAAMAHALKGDDMAVATAEIDEALALAQELAIPTLLGGTRAFAAFVLADIEPDRALVLMREALQSKEAQRLRGMPVHGILGDVAERLGHRRQALEFFMLGMNELHWLGNTEMVGRMLRRIGIRLVEHDPEAAAFVIGAGTSLSHGWTLTERVVEDQRRAIEALNAALGADRRAELMAQGAVMEEYDAVLAARAAATRVLAGDDGLHDLTPDAASPDVNAFRREGDMWAISYDGTRIQLRDAKGLRYLAHLLSQAGREVHVTDLAADTTGGEVPPSGSGGHVLDEAAKAAYHQRLRDLETEIAEATDWNDAERAARAQAEIDALTEQLAAAYGLAGRARTMGDPVERVRKAVTNRIRDSLDRISAEHDALGRHLANAVHTGTFCSYTPEQPIAWEL